MERFEGGLDLVGSAVRHLCASGAHAGETDDLEAWGRAGLLEAARRFEPERGVSFRTFAYYRVRGAMIDGIRKMAPLSRRAHERLSLLQAAHSTSEGASEDLSAVRADLSSSDAQRMLQGHLATMATAMAVGLLCRPAWEGTEPVAEEPGEGPEARLANAELAALLREALADLPPPEDEVVRRHYLESEALDSIGKSLGLSKSWTSRLHTRALKRLTKRLRGLDD